MNYVISFVTIFSIFAAFGLDNVEIRELAKGKKEKTILGTSFALRILSSLFAFFIIVLILFLKDIDYSTSTLIMIYSLSVFLSSFNCIRNFFTAKLQNKYIVLTEILRCSIGAVFKICLLLINAPLIWFIIALTFDFVLVASGYTYSYKKKISKCFNWTFDFNTAKYLLKEGFPLLLSGAAVIIYQRIDQIIINDLLSAEAVGYFSAAAKFSEFILFVPLIMSQTMSPVLVKTRESNKSNFKIYSQLFCDLIVWVSIGLAIIMSLLSTIIITYTYGSEYLPAITVLQIMSFKTIGMSLSNVSGQLIIIENKQRLAVLRNIVGCIFCVLGNYLLIPKYGIEGSAIATIITVIMSGFIANYFIPSYREYFYIQIKSIISGPCRLLNHFINHV